MPDPLLGTQPTKKFTTGRLYWLPAGAADGFIDFGNVQDYKAVPKVSRLDHFSARKGSKVADLSLVKSQSVIRSFTLDEEFNQTLLLLALANQNANTIQPAAIGADDTIVTADNVNI